MGIRNYNGIDWEEINNMDWYEGVAKLGEVEKTMEIGDKLKVIYKDGEEIWYDNVFGTWGKPVVYR